MATPNKQRKSEWKSADLSLRAEGLQREVEMLETTLGPFVALSPNEHKNADDKFNVGT